MLPFNYRPIYAVTWTQVRPALIIATIGVLVLVLAIAAPFIARAQGDRRVDAVVVFVADVSGSMNMDERRFVRNAHAYAITSDEVLDVVARGPFARIAVCYVEYASEAVLWVDWTIVDGLASAVTFADAILAPRAAEDDSESVSGGLPPYSTSTQYLGGSTSPGTGLVVAHAALMASPWVADKIVVDVVGDGVGEFGDMQRAQNARDTLVDLGAAINALLIVLDPSETPSKLATYFGQNVVGGPGHFILNVDTIDQLPVALRQKLVAELF